METKILDLLWYVLGFYGLFSLMIDIGGML